MKTRVNNDIKAKTVRLIGDNGKQLGLMSLQEALREASQVDKDLIEISNDKGLPICIIEDYGRYRYEQDRKKKLAKKNQKVIVTKEIRFSLATEEHDLDTKINNINKFIDKGYRVKVSLFFKGREITHKDLGYKKLNYVIERTNGKVYRDFVMEGKNLTVILT